MMRHFLIFSLTCFMLTGPAVLDGICSWLQAPAPPPQATTLPDRVVLYQQTRRASCAKLVAQLEATSAEVREAAVVALADARCDHRLAVPALARRLQDPVTVVRWATDRALIAYGPRAAAAVPALVAALGDPETVEWAPTVLIAVGPEAVPALTKALDDRRPHVRSSAAFTLGGIGSEAPLVTAKLLRLARKDKSWLVRRTARWAVASIHDKIPSPPGPPKVGELVEVMNDPSGAAWAPSLLCASGEHAVPSLIRALSHKKAGTRRTAAWALGCMGEKAEKALPALRRAARSDRSRQVRQEAALSAEGIKDSVEWQRQMAED